MADLAKLVDELSALTVMEAADLSKMLEEKWGVHIALGGPDLLRIVLHQEGTGDHQVLGIKVIGIGDAVKLRGHLPNEQISGLNGLWFSVQCKVHSPGFAEKVDVVISVEIVRYIRI